MKFLADVRHVRRVAKFEKENHLFTVREDGDPSGTGLYVDAADFGCSRTYKTDSPVYAIELFLAEHACRPLNIREIAE